MYMLHKHTELHYHIRVFTIMSYLIYYSGILHLLDKRWPIQGETVTIYFIPYVYAYTYVYMYTCLLIRYSV